jgi:tetratricopeptide (TPR) repeat protein
MSEHEHLPAAQRIERGVAAWDRSDYKAALEDFRAVLAEHPGFPDVHNKAGLCLAMLGNPEQALQSFDEAIRINPGYAEAHLNRAIVLQELGRFREARLNLRRAEELDLRDSGEFPSDVGHKLALAHARLGDLYLLADHPEEAAEQYQRALDIRSRFLDVRTKYAGALMGMGRWTEARHQLQMILDRNPRFTSARLRLGVVLHRLGDVAGARREWERCVQEDPEDMRAKAYLAFVSRGGAAAG